ncbi:MAG: hypothetical protein ABJE95_03515 [Byssovorax sp.]
MNHEQAVADAFNISLRRKAEKIGRKVHSYALDGQDRDAGDYLLTDESKFAIVEFKYTDPDISLENRKSRRLRLCRLLETNSGMTTLHDQCHFVAWMQRPKQDVHLNIYRHEVCNREIFGTECGLKCASPSFDSRVLASQFADEVLDTTGTRTLSLAEFERYLAWLMGVASQGPKRTLEILVNDDRTDDVRLVQLSSIRQVYDWFQARRSSATASQNLGMSKAIE